jgi:hypothetical protein
MTEDPILAAIARLGADLRAETVTSRTEIMARCDQLEARIEAVAKQIERMVRLYGR